MNSVGVGFLEKSDSNGGFQFVHDRIQQAAYSLLNEEER
jgi:predicted ATPase